ncbi:ATP-binding protein [Acidovorax sp. Leaf78]|uniref:HD domain-containing protein n=1 Tax=Acidovorax sp. Leaf78 TaxID=1736237 RepID=UPI0009EC35EA|nr:ATP-binding protein [Acidovorax sp. Leaf78]
MYEYTSLWQTAFGNRSDNLNPQREILRRAYNDFRDRVVLLLAKIQSELPALTLHDITHIDALWRVASEIAGPSFEINAAEALVLGGAFLMHDAAHCRAAFPGGIDEIRQTVEWQDSAAQRNFSTTQLTEGSPGFQAVLFDTLRVLHPQRARGLPFAKWSDGVGNLMHLFPHDELREAYGHIIGEIAESHWYNPNELEYFSTKTVTPPVCISPASWKVNTLKVAILLRVADAAHIDSRRAPRLLLALNQPGGISQEHWRFQARLNQPSCDVGRAELIFSGSPFPENEKDAWWLAYDAACLVNKELSAADHLLRDNHLQTLAAKEVAGAHSPESFSRNVPTQGWHPVDSSIRISDIKSVVGRFGGAKLYGEKPHLALRELLQNARDAIEASRALGALGGKEGSITVQLEEREGEHWLHVTDTGIGMSRFVLLNVLLDFGRSLWKDTVLPREWPGLAATGFKAIGRFGIGFFAVFMLGNQVKVITKRQTASIEDSNSDWVLDFASGIASRPILRKPLPDEALRRHGTKVSVRLLNQEKLLQLKKSSFDLFSGLSTTSETLLKLEQVVGALAPALEIDIFTQEGGNQKIKTISAGDWREIAPLDLIDRICPGRFALSPFWITNDLEVATKNLSPMANTDGTIFGRCSIIEYTDSIFGLQAGVITVGGLYGGSISGIAGVLAGEQADLLDRSVAIPTVDKITLATWSEEQAGLLRAAGQLTWKRSAKLLALGANSDELLIITHSSENWTSNRFSSELNNIEEIWLLQDREMQYQSDIDDVLKSDFERNFNIDPRVFTIQSGVSLNEFIQSSSWPSQFFKENLTNPSVVVEKILNDVWPNGELKKVEDQVIGHVAGTAIRRDVEIILKNKLIEQIE